MNPTKKLADIFTEFERPAPMAPPTVTRLTPDAESFWQHVLLPATANVQRGFMMLDRANASRVWRERVYAYELYHQMRCLWKKWEYGETYFLNGEVDKRGYPPVRDLKGKNPDFIVHEPGTHERNLLVLEIKTQDASGTKLREDVEKIQRYIEHRELRYKSGILLVIGSKPRRLKGALKAAERWPIEVAVHAHPANAAERAE